MSYCVASIQTLIPISKTGGLRASIHNSSIRFLKPLLTCKRRDFYVFGFVVRNVGSSKSPGRLGFDEFQFEESVGVKDTMISDLRTERSREESETDEEDGLKEVSDAINELASAGVEFLERNGDGVKLGRKRKKGIAKGMDLDLNFAGKERSLRRGRNVLKRSSLIAKQVISVQSAISLGFVCQLWVDASTWRAQVVEVRTSLLSGESERFLLKDVLRVGDVVLVQDESVLDSETQLIGLETVVGYDVFTAGRRRIGKVRGYSFDIDSGAVESLELDSFGISIIPSGLVSTYMLLVEDVLEVLPDEIVVHEAAASRMQRLTKGIWGTKNAKTVNNAEDLDQSPLPLEQPRSLRKKSSKQKFHQDTNQKEDDWELPIDYL